VIQPAPAHTTCASRRRHRWVSRRRHDVPRHSMVRCDAWNERALGHRPSCAHRRLRARPRLGLLAMPTAHPTETEEWLAARVDSWVETYKKALLTPVVLQLISADEPASVAEITHRIRTTTGWEITERGLYRTLKRLQDSQL